jgi:PAS domain-containing protein
MLVHFHRELKDFQYIVFVDSSRRYVDCSDGVLSLLGYSRSEFLSKTIDDISYWLADVPSLFKDFIRHGKQEGTYVLKNVDGAPLPIQYRSFLFPDGCKAAGFKLITDWRAAYFTAIAEADSGSLGHRIDVALAAIYRRMFVNQAQLTQDDEGSALSEALSTLSSLRNGVPTALCPDLLEFEKTRSALLRLAVKIRDSKAIRVMYEENRQLIEASIQLHFHSSELDKILPTLLDRVALKARYYDPNEDPRVWLQDCIPLECRRLKNEMHL